MILSNFNDKLDKIEGNVYAIEEEAFVSGGKYEAELLHDNINDDTVQVWTGKQLTGTRVGYRLTIQPDRPYKRVIQIATEAEKVYISYETTGDQVEAEDINRLQTELVRTQNFANQISDDIRGSTSAYTWNRLMGIVTTASLQITTQPTAAEVAAGETAEFTVAAAGEGMAYRWQYIKTDDRVWSDFADGTKTTLAVVTDATWNRAKIRCIVSDANGNVAVSDSVLLTVTTAG